MLQNSYDIDSDSDEEEENAQSNKEYPLVHDIQALKTQTMELLDPVWKENRNKQLLMKMLNLDEPIITAKMIDFLLQEGVCEILLGFVTLIGQGAPRPTPADSQSETLKLSYKAVLVLSADDPSEPLVNLFSKRTVAITRTMFEIFRDDSSASFYHSFRIFECLLRCFPGDVYEGICGDGKASERIASLLKYIGFAPVGELLVMIIALTPISRVSQLYVTCTKSRWSFFEQLSQWLFLLRVTEIVGQPEKFCHITSEVDADEHSSAASQVFQELVEKLSLEDIGEILLQPLGFTTQLLDLLVNAATDMTYDNSRRRTSIQLLCFLLRRAAEPEVMCMVAGAPGNVSTPTIVPNRVHPLRERIINHLESRMPEIFTLISTFDSLGAKNMCAVSGPIVLSGYRVDQPFSAMRALLVEYMTLMVESDEMIAIQLPVPLWRLLLQWTLKYAHNSIYHAFVYRLVFAVLRQNQEAAMRNLFQKARLVTFLIDAYVPYSTPLESNRNMNNGSVKSKSSAASTSATNNKNKPSLDQINKCAARGVILNCVNAIRLQASCMPPSSYICQFLATHPQWSSFCSAVTAETQEQQYFGMGIKILESRGSVAGLNMMMMTPNDFRQEAADSGVEHGSRFAKSLGFYDDVPWTASETDNGDPSVFGDLREMTLEE